MISLKKYLDTTTSAAVAERAVAKRDESGAQLPLLAAYGSALLAIGAYSVEACAALGEGLKVELSNLQAKLSASMSRAAVEAAEKQVQDRLQDWGRRTSKHYRDKAEEVRELLLVMARTAESVGSRDKRCAEQIGEVTSRLNAIACLEDLSEIRASIQKSAIELRTSIDRMTLEGRAVLDDLRQQVSTYQTKLVEAEQVASRDVLTGLRSRLSLENLLESRMQSGTVFSLAMVDIDGFKAVNDAHGHLAGDELLKQFASELKSACRSKDVIVRWGGDEFVIVLDCNESEASVRIERLKKWVCGDYTVTGTAGPVKLVLGASIGLAEHVKGESMKALLARADTAMYVEKGHSQKVSAR